jgi:hypothetical protein
LRRGAAERSALLLAAGLWCGAIGCEDPLYTLGTLSSEASKRDPCPSSTAIAPGRCAASPGEGDAGVRDAALSSPVEAAADAARDGGRGRAHDAAPEAAALPCAASRVPAVRKGLTVFLLVDDSLSVVLQPMWLQVTQGISGFLDDPANAALEVGIEYYGISCSPGDYAVPAVGIDALSAAATAIKGSYPVPISGKALTPALEGTLSYLRGAAARDPDRDVVLVLVTDGIADPLCGSDLANATGQIAAASHSASAPVPTYVIALGAGPTFLDPANRTAFGPLDSLAAEGGTDRAARVALDLATNDELTLALDQVVTRATSCAYRVPRQIDPSRAALEWTPSPGATPVYWPRVDPAACGTQPGVFVRSTAPEYLELCPVACQEARANPAGTVVAREACTVR